MADGGWLRHLGERISMPMTSGTNGQRTQFKDIFSPYCLIPAHLQVMIIFVGLNYFFTRYVRSLGFEGGICFDYCRRPSRTWEENSTCCQHQGGGCRNCPSILRMIQIDFDDLQCFCFHGALPICMLFLRSRQRNYLLVSFHCNYHNSG